MRAIYEALDEVRGVTNREPHLQVLVPATLAFYWLLPRLAALRQSGLKLKADVRHTNTHENWLDVPFDIEIRSDREIPSANARVSIFHDRLGLVAAPKLADVFRKKGGVCALTFLESETRPGQLDDWLTCAGLARDELRRVEAFERNYIAIEAALIGQGAIVAPLAVVGNHLVRGSLVQLLADITVVGSEFSAVYDRLADNARYARAFAGWLQTMALTQSSNSPPAGADLSAAPALGIIQ